MASSISLSEAATLPCVQIRRTDQKALRLPYPSMSAPCSSTDRSSQDQVAQWVLGFCDEFDKPVRPPDADIKRLRLAFLPGTGIQSGGLCRAFAKAGCSVIVASRTLSKAQAKMQELLLELPTAQIEARDLRSAAGAADVIFWLMPTTTQLELTDSHMLLADLKAELQGKVIVDVTNVMWALDETQWGQTSSTILNQTALGVPASWTCAFKHVYYRLIDGSSPPDMANPHNVFVCGDDPGAVGLTMALVDLLPGFRALFAGNVKYTRIVELLSPLWLPQLERDNYGLNFTAGWRFGP